MNNNLARGNQPFNNTIHDIMANLPHYVGRNQPLHELHEAFSQLSQQNYHNAFAQQITKELLSLSNKHSELEKTKKIIKDTIEKLIMKGSPSLAKQEAIIDLTKQLRDLKDNKHSELEKTKKIIEDTIKKLIMTESPSLAKQEAIIDLTKQLRDLEKQSNSVKAEIDQVIKKQFEKATEKLNPQLNTNKIEETPKATKLNGVLSKDYNNRMKERKWAEAGKGNLNIGEIIKQKQQEKPLTMNDLKAAQRREREAKNQNQTAEPSSKPPVATR